MWKNILTILVITQLALPYVLGNQIKLIPPRNPPNPRPSCASTKCLQGNHCELQLVTCLCCAPCFPVPTCIDDSIPGCSIVECPEPKICVLKMGSTDATCVDEVPDASS